MSFVLITPEDVSRALSEKVKRLRLDLKWKRVTLAARSGVTEASLRRFEQTGRISLDHFLRLAHALGRLDEFSSLLNPPEARTLKELEQKENRARLPRRGSI